jgi:FAD/FMN-containing dehydrogenase/Fe-S oxidoreductase
MGIPLQLHHEPAPAPLAARPGRSRELRDLAADLTAAIRGEVRFDPGSRALYATDGSNYRQPPIGVVIPMDIQDVERAVAICREHDAPIFGRGGGTSLAGQCCNAAVCFDMSKYMNKVLEIDPERRLARVQPGTILDDLRNAAAAYGLTYGPDPSTHTHCTLGGMIGNNSCGVHSVMAQFAGTGPRTSDQVEWLDVLTYDGTRLRVGATSEKDCDEFVRGGGRRGEIYERLRALRDTHEDVLRSGMPHIPRRVSGYNIDALLAENGFNVAHALCGSESTCVLVLEAMVRLIPNPKARTLVVLGYPSVYEAGDHVPQIMSFRPIGCEGMDDRLVKDIESVGHESEVLQILPDGQGFLLVEFGGDSREEADAKARAMLSALATQPGAPTSKLFDDPAQEKKVAKVREAGLGATAHVDRRRPTWEGWEDAGVPPERLGAYLRAFRSLLDKHRLHGDLYGHFGQGCVHTRIDFDLETAAGIAQYRQFVEAAAGLVVSFGGSLSGEHGDGQSRGELLPKMYGPRIMAAFHEFKSIWDPAWKMNPGKIIDPYRLDENLRLGTSYDPPPLQTHFHYPNDLGTFAKATLRCVGVGDCRRLDGGTMCPSFMVTREEKHSTRGRARLLFEMLEGDPLRGGWQSEEVKDALDLCFSCKGCKGECPVKVDMATYKAEFLSHYYERHRRPISAFAFGLIHYWARIGSLAPDLVNLVTQAPLLNVIAKLGSGMAFERRIPPFAPFTFKDWFARRPEAPRTSGPRVILWADTFNNHFHPHTAIAAVHALERAGFHVVVPQAPLCCGRPLYDYGMLDTAKQWLRQILDALSTDIAAGTPVVGLEPSCVAVFRDEMGELMVDDEQAKRLAKQTFALSEFLTDRGCQFPRLDRHALVHGHCHHKAVLGFDKEQEALKRMGIEAKVLESGCCGMAGSFGFERDHYAISMKAGERVLLPAVRSAPRDTLIVADGFSCRTQIHEGTDRRALHLADVIEMAYREGPHGAAGELPEAAYVPDYAALTRPSARSKLLTGAAIAAGVAVGYAASRRSRRQP